MNIENYKPIQGLTFDDVFKMQKEIKFKYEPESVEIFKNFDIDCFEDQEIFKKYCWRIVEEITEAIEAKSDKKHYIEELIDALNFIVELYLLYGLNYNDVKDVRINECSLLGIITQIGLTANCLKNRQWRSSQYIVDLIVFEKRFKEIFNKFLTHMKFTTYLSEEEILEAWSLKYQVNLFRIETKY